MANESIKISDVSCPTKSGITNPQTIGMDQFLVDLEALKPMKIKDATVVISSETENETMRSVGEIDELMYGTLKKLFEIKSSVSDDERASSDKWVFDGRIASGSRDALRVLDEFKEKIFSILDDNTSMRSRLEDIISQQDNPDSLFELYQEHVVPVLDR